MPLPQLLDLHRRYDGPIPEWERGGLLSPVVRLRSRVVFWGLRVERAEKALRRGQASAGQDLADACRNLRLVEAAIGALEGRS